MGTSLGCYYDVFVILELFWTTMEINIFTFLRYPGTLMYLPVCILVLLYVFTWVYKITQIKKVYWKHLVKYK